MRPYPGIGTLETPRDLLEKLRHDLARMHSDRGNSYAAFDFFVTAEHMIDWVLPGEANRQQRRDLRSKQILLQIASHIANGSKHFITEARHHHSVQHVDVAYSSEVGLDTSVVGPLVLQVYVVLDGDAARAYGRTVAATDLAEKIVAYWGSYVEGLV